MNTLIFLSGVVIGALITTFLVIAFLGYAARKVVLSKEQREKADRQHEELIAIHKERNRLVGLQTKSLCQHRTVTVSEGDCHCDHCGFPVAFNAQTGNWQ